VGLEQAPQRNHIFRILRKGAFAAAACAAVMGPVEALAPALRLTPLERADEALRHYIRVSKTMQLPSKTEQTGRSVDDINRAMREFDLRAVPQ
jgi:hypothetical protein